MGADRLRASCGHKPGLSGLRDAALVPTMSGALLRRASETSAITVADIHGQADGSGLLILARSKTDQEGKGQCAVPRAAYHAAHHCLPAGSVHIGRVAL